MNEKTKRNGWRKARRWASYIFLGFLGLVFLVGLGSTGNHIFRTLREARKFPPPGDMIDVGGYRLHLFGRGEGEPAVIMEAPSGGSSLGWRRVQDEVSKTTRVYAYDRAGYAWSESGPKTRDIDAFVNDLGKLLKNARVKTPVVLVGHSYGAAIVRLFALRHPETVAGLVLVDPTPESIFSLNPRAAAEHRESLRPLGLMRVLSFLGIGRILNVPLGEASSAALPQDLFPAARAIGFRTRWMNALARELEAVEQSLGVMQREFASRPEPALGDIPMVLLTRVDSGQTPAEKDDYRIWLKAHQDMLRSSNRSRHIVAEKSGHFIQVDEPDLVVRAILSLVEMNRR